MRKCWSKECPHGAVRIVCGDAHNPGSWCGDVLKERAMFWSDALKETLRSPVQLQEMDVSFNHLAEVQPSISECRQLTYINMSDNQIEVPLPIEERRAWKRSRTFIWKPRPESGRACPICSIFTRPRAARGSPTQLWFQNHTP